MIVADNGTKLTSRAVLSWGEESGIERNYIAPSKRVQNRFVETFNGKLRDEWLNEHVFTSLSEARRIVESWRIDYNTVRPNSSLGGLPKWVFANRPLTRGHFEAGPLLSSAGKWGANHVPVRILKLPCASQLPCRSAINPLLLVNGNADVHHECLGLRVMTGKNVRNADPQP